MVLEYFEREDINEFFDVFARDYKKARTWLVDNICMLETLLPEMAKDLGESTKMSINTIEKCVYQIDRWCWELHREDMMMKEKNIQNKIFLLTRKKSTGKSAKNST